ncbi:hypothetical protein BME09_06100 [Klebsiella pneumoniae]|nr:hypothetical protein BME12_05785 [Klebsiella pneumoniae]OVU87609.1 hypothetical protein BME09_06100 [Klebsiella pneumoniae]
MVCVVGRMRDLILQLSKSSIYSTKPSHIVKVTSNSLRDLAHCALFSLRCGTLTNAKVHCRQRENKCVV